MMENKTPRLSYSVGKYLLTHSPFHCWINHRDLNPNYEQAENNIFDIGRAVHALILEKDGSGIVVIDAPDYRTNAAREQRDAVRKAGKFPVLAAKAPEVKAMALALKNQLSRHETGWPFHASRGEAEKKIVWQEKGGAVECAARLDWIASNEPVIYDLKTVTNAHPDAVIRLIFANSWDIQAAFYVRAMKKTTGKNYKFRFLAQETEAPFAASVVELKESALELASEKVEEMIERWHWCTTNKKWPGYPAMIAYADVPPWEVNKWADEQARKEMAQDQGRDLLELMLEMQAPANWKNALEEAR